MRELLIVLHREFVERVRSRSFVVSTILTPLLLALFVLGPRLLDRGREGTTLHVALVEAPGGSVAEAAAARLRMPAETPAEDRFFVEILRASPAAVDDSLSGRVASGALDAYVLVPADVEAAASIPVRSAEPLVGSARRRLEAALSAAVQGRRLREAGLSAARLSSLLRPVRLEETRVRAGAEAGPSESGLILAVLVGFFLYMLIMLFGTQVMHSVQEEKANRIAEVLVSSIRAPQLMLGKVLGVGLAALLQVAIWVAAAFAILSRPAAVTQMGVPASVLSAFAEADPKVLASALLYLLLGFFLYATLFAAVGAAMSSSDDAQRFTLPLILPLILPVMLSEQIVSAPRGSLAVTLSWIPLTSPLVMPMRVGVDGASTAEVATTLIFLALSVAAVGWLAGKIYRVGILSTGKRASFADLVRWIRMA